MKVRYAKIAAALAIAVAPTVIVYVYLNAKESVLILLGYSLAVIAVSSARLFVRRRWELITLTVVEALLHLTGVVAIAVSLTLTPSSAYLAWFRLAQDGEPAGILSYMFAMKVCVLSTAAAVVALRRNVVSSLLAAVSLTLLILYAIFQQSPLIVVSGILGAVVLVTGLIRGRRAVRRVMTLTGIIVVSGLLSYPLSRTEPGLFNPLVSIVPSHSIATAIMAVYPNFPFLYNMPGYGHQLGENQIGGRPALTERPVFSVTGRPGETIYLRTAVFDRYTGQGWQTTGVGSHDSAARSGAFTNDDPATYQEPLRVETLIDFFSSIPHTVDTEYINFYRGDFPPLSYGDYDTGFLFEYPIVSGTVFYLDRGVTDRWESPTNLGRYLQEPEVIPESVSELASLLDGGTPDRTAERIKRYLAANFFYSLDTSRPRENTDAAWNFLMNDGRGYCVHFATAFTLLARLNGIPARYVTGFLIHIPFDSDTTVVPGYSSHSWSEIWTPESGWVVQEATPPMSPEFFDDPSYYDLYNPFDSSYTGRQLEIIMGDRIPSRPEDSRTVADRIDLLPFLVTLIAIIGVVAIAVFVAYSSLAPGSKRRKIKLAARTLLRRSRRIGAEDPESDGWTSWGDSIRDVVPESQIAARTLNRVYFSTNDVTSEDIRTIRRIAATVPRRAQ